MGTERCGGQYFAVGGICVMDEVNGIYHFGGILINTDKYSYYL